jgi:hypothetical protein
MAFALSELHGSQRDFEPAAHYLKLANQLSGKDLNYRPQRFHAWIQSHIKVFDEDYFERLEAVRGARRETIFVVGMPRSGTTLVEQILAAHPAVFGAGELDLLPNLVRLMPGVLDSSLSYPQCMRELTPELREQAAQYYLHGLDQYDTEHPAVVDKMPHNFVNLGLIASILPAARIIHVRRDPRDVALSNYQQNFKARHGGMGFAFDLEHIAEQINDYYRIMAHWQAVLPLPVLDIRYEDLVADQAQTTRAMLDFLSLDWDDTVMAFENVERAVRTASVSQVREPLYSSSSGKWRSYQALLEPLLAALDEATLEGWP